jgi:hypothetical protein
MAIIRAPLPVTSVVKKILQPDNVQLPATVNLPLLSSDQIERMMLADSAERVTAFACVAESILPAAIQSLRAACCVLRECSSGLLTFHRWLS